MLYAIALSNIYLRGGGTIQSPGKGAVFVADKLFISTRLGGALIVFNCITSLYRTLLTIQSPERGGAGFFCCGQFFFQLCSAVR